MLVALEVGAAEERAEYRNVAEPGDLAVRVGEVVLQQARDVGIATRFGDIIGAPLPPVPPMTSGDSAARVPVPVRNP